MKSRSRDRRRGRPKGKDGRRGDQEVSGRIRRRKREEEEMGRRGG